MAAVAWAMLRVVKLSHEELFFEGGLAMAGYRNVKLNQLWSKDHYWHADMSIIGLPEALGEGDVRFKLFGHKKSYGLEFRRLEDWPNAFAIWPGMESDDYGDLYRILCNAVLVADLFTHQDATMLKNLALALPDAVSRATAQLQEHAQCLEAARQVSSSLLSQLNPDNVPLDPIEQEPEAAPAPPGPQAASTDTALPEYIRTVLREFETVQLNLLKSSLRPLPDRWTPIVICVVKDEIDRLHDFLRHYRTAGVERFCFIDNGSTDGTLHYLLAQPDADVYERPGKFDWMLKQGWINRAVRLYGTDRWFMYVDADEHIVFDGIAGHSFRDLTLTMERQGIRRVRGFLLDMYADSPLMKSTYQPHTSLFDAYPYFDTNTYVEQRYKEIISVKGGPRPRVFGGANAKFRPEMTKYPLFCSQPADYMVNPHHHWPYEENFASGRYLVILHYKFLPGIIEKIRRAVIEQNYWDGSLEYRCYLSVIESNPDVSLMGEMSARYSGPSSLLSRGLIENIPWETEHHLQRISRAAFHQRRAEIDGANGLSRHLANPAAA